MSEEKYKSFEELKEELGKDYDYKLYEMGISALKELDRLSNLNKQLVEECQRLDDEETRLNNIINELEKWCNECIDYHIIARENGDTTISDTFFKIVLDKLKALKEDNK